MPDARRTRQWHSLRVTAVDVSGLTAVTDAVAVRVANGPAAAAVPRGGTPSSRSEAGRAVLIAALPMLLVLLLGLTRRRS